MTSNGPLKAVLSEALEKAVNGRPVKAGIFTTYGFDPGFFEQNVLRCLFRRAWGQSDHVRALQLQEQLREIEHLCVFYDRRALEPGHTSYGGDYRRIDVSRANGVFHAKNVLLLVRNKPQDEGDEPYDSLLMLTTSANLTASGWLTNLEVVHVAEIAEDEETPLRNDLLAHVENGGGFLARLYEHDLTGESHETLDIFREFLLNQVTSKHRRRRMIREERHFRFYAGKKPFTDFLTEDLSIAPREYRLEIISPYFDKNAPVALQKLLDAVQPKETRVFLPRGNEGVTECSETYYQAVWKMDAVKWGDLPGNLIQFSGRESDAHHRRVHAKIYRFFTLSPYREIQVVGSVNLTDRAHSRDNFETAIAIDYIPSSKPVWWLKDLEAKPQIFRDDVRSEDDPEDAPIPNLSLRYHWTEGCLSYYWQSRGPMAQRVKILSGNRELGIFAPEQFDRWMELPMELAKAVRQELISSALLKIALDDQVAGWILVREEGMESKPSLLERLTAEEILEYWSLLTPEQKDAFLENKVASLLKARQLQDQRNPANALRLTEESQPTCFFDRFSGIFHAFSCLEEHVFTALGNGQKREAAHRLFGESFESLKTLADRLTKDLAQRQGQDMPDPVNGYVSLLCARDILRKVTQKQRTFLKEHRSQMTALREQVENILADIKRQELTADPEAAPDFLKWFEAEFSREVGLPRRAEER